jgi:hypothetical protein
MLIKVKMVFAKINNGQIEKTGTLYELLPNVSNPQNFSEIELKELGIYKVVDDTTTIFPWQRVINTEIVFNNDVVNEVKTIEDIPLDEFKNIKYNQIKETGKRFILDKYSIEKQTSALAGFYPPEEAQAILDFTKLYFGKIRLAKDAVYNATTYEEVNAVYFKKDIIDETTLEIINTVFWGD